MSPDAAIDIEFRCRDASAFSRRSQTCTPPAVRGSFDVAAADTAARRFFGARCDVSSGLDVLGKDFEQRLFVRKRQSGGCGLAVHRCCELTPRMVSAILAMSGHCVVFLWLLLIVMYRP